MSDIQRINTLYMPISRKWFKMIKSGEKKEEYRELKAYWFKRLVFQHTKTLHFFNIKDSDLSPEWLKVFFISGKYLMVAFKPFDIVIFSNGYSKKAQKLAVECLGISIGFPNPDWCDGWNNPVFKIQLGQVISDSPGPCNCLECKLESCQNKTTDNLTYSQA